MKREEFFEKMQKKSGFLGVRFCVKQLEQFFEYMELLIEWNEKMNLTAITDPEEIILKQKTVPTTEQTIQKPTSYIILDGEKFENNEENRQKVAQYFAKVADPNGGSKALNQIKDLIFEASQNGYSINYDTPGNELSYIDPTGQSHFIDWSHLNDRKDKRIQKERS